MPSRYSVLVSFVLIASASFAQFRSSGLPKNEQVQNVVREFCRQDFMGARLSDAGWNRVKQLVTWKDNSAWRSFHVVARYDQTDVSTGLRGGRVDVKYMVLGRFELGAGYTAAPETETAEFRLKDIDGDWRIDDTDPDLLEPHISKQAAIQWLQEKQKSVTDRGEKVSIETALKTLAPPQK